MRFITFPSSVLGCGWQVAPTGFLLSNSLSRVIEATYPLAGEKYQPLTFKCLWFREDRMY